MSFKEITLIISLFSFFGMLLLVLKKIPVLVSLPLAQEEGFNLGIKDKIKNIPSLKSFSSEMMLQKMISQIRVLSLKTDNKTFIWLKNLREKNQKNKLEDENYWENIKSSTDLKK